MVWEQTATPDDDYVFRYRIDEPSSGGDSHRDSRLELVRKDLRSILDIAIPCNGDSEVKIDGFKLMNNRGVVHRLFDQDEEDITSSDGNKEGVPLSHKNRMEPDRREGNFAEREEKNTGCSFQSAKNAAIYEPTIEYIKRRLESLLDLVDLEKDGKAVKVDGFRLKDLSQWVEESTCDPADLLVYIANRCNCNCIFCYNRGCPPSLALVSPSRYPEEEFKEVETRLRYFSPGRGRALFTSLGTCFEAFIHPRFRDVLEGIRQKTGRLIRMSTNGTTLTSEMIDYLSGFGPFHLDIALHSSSPTRRHRLMHDRTPGVAINSLPLLRKAGIVYDIAIVPWPDGSIGEMLDDLEKTVHYADKNLAHLVQICLPGYSRYFSEKTPFNHDFVWETVTKKVRDIRPQLEVPIVVRPAIYEEGLFCRKKNVPEIIGTVKGSPAYYGDLRRGDIITRIGGNLMRNRPAARGLFSVLQTSGTGSVAVEVLRKGRRLELLLDLGRVSYPYSKEVDTHLGTVFMGAGLRAGYLESLQELIKEKKAKNILLLTSLLVKPLLEQIISESLFFGGGDFSLDIRVPTNRFFGGNICMGDLLVVEDYIDYLRDYISLTGTRPELVVIPSSPFNLGGWGRDLTGRVYLDIERETGIPVEVLECQTIYD